MKNIKQILIATVLFFGLSSVASAYTFNTDLTYGSVGADVTALQQFLTDQGNYSGPVTGNFYSLTRQALISFQVQKGITPSLGYFGPITRSVVNSLSSNVVDNSTSTDEVVLSPNVNSLQAQLDALLNEVAQLQARLASSSQATSSTPVATSTPVTPINHEPEPQPLLDNTNHNMEHYDAFGQDNVEAWYFNDQSNTFVLDAEVHPDITYSLVGQPRFAHIPNKLNALFSVLFGSSRASELYGGYTSEGVRKSYFDSVTVSAILPADWNGISLEDYTSSLNQNVKYGLKLTFTRTNPNGSITTYSKEFGNDFIKDNGIYPVITN